MSKDENGMGGTILARRQYNSGPHDGTPCNICGTTTNGEGKSIDTVFKYAMHRHWHVRKGEARMNAAGEIVPTAAGKAKFREYLKGVTIVAIDDDAQSGMGQVRQEIVHSEEDTSVPIQIPDTSADVLKTLTNALLLVQFASLINGMPPEAAMQVLGTIKHMGNNMPPLRRR